MSQTDDELDLEVLGFLAGGLPPLAPGGSLRDRLLGIAGGQERFLPFLDRMMQMFDLPEDAANGELRTIDQDQPDADDDEHGWDDLAPGVRFRDFEGGPGIGDAHGGLIRVQPGASFPPHEHASEEVMLILQGEVEDENGQRWEAGDTITSAQGTHHTLTCVSDEEVIYAARVVAINFLGDEDDDDDDDDVDLD